MGNIFFTADWHFNHDREFIYKPRGFNSIYEMNEALIERHNSVVNPEDDVYVLGDLMLGNNEEAIKMVKQLKGNLHIVRGNHDTNSRMAIYNDCWNVVDINEGQYFKFGKYNFYLNHYPTFTSNLEKSPHMSEHIVNLFGHTHQKTNFYNEIPFMYHVGVDSHLCYPVKIEKIIEDIKNEIADCLDYL